MNTNILDKIKKKELQIRMEKDSVKLSELNKQLKKLKLQREIEGIREKINKVNKL